MNRSFSSIVRHITTLGICTASALSALEIDNTSNSVFDLYFFGNDESGLFGTLTGIEWQDTPRMTSGHVKDASAYYWNTELKQAMQNAVNTWTTAISTPYDTDKHARKLRIGFFLDDGSTPGGVMATSMAGYASSNRVITEFQQEYGTQVNNYSITEWAWRDNNETAYYPPPAGMAQGAYWETNLLPDGENCIDIAIVLNPLITSYGFDANGYYYYNQTARTAQELQNVATHEIGHGMGMDSSMYTQTNDGATLSGYVSTWDTLLTLNGEHIITVQDGEIDTDFVSLSQLQAAGWEVPEGKDATDSNSYTGNEIQYDPARRLSLEGEVGVHISAILLEGDTMKHISHGDGNNVLGPGGTANFVFSENDLRTLELLGWNIRRETTSVPEPSGCVLLLLGLTGLTMHRKRK